jgi:hypothetical protein
MRSCWALRLGLVCSSLLVAAPAAAQLAIYDALARSFSDVSFSAAAGGLGPRASGIAADRLTFFGLEVLLEIGSINRPTGAPAPVDSVSLRWREMRVVHTAAGVDTVYEYDVVRLPRAAPTEPVWIFEVGVGYGQTTGYRSTVPGLELAGSIRDLPALSLYAFHVNTGTYAGVRSGLMRLHGLQLYDEEGRTFEGDAESFGAGVALGQGMTLLGLDFFVETSYAFRHFPSVRWSGSPPPRVPRRITANSWSLGAGIQFGVGRR